MEVAIKRHIKSGARYDHLFPKPIGNDLVILKKADVADTVKLIPKAVYSTLPDTLKISKVLKGSSLQETCSNIWHFVYDHIQYKKDKKGIEQVRRPARAWNDRMTGVDCDCYTVFISSILTNLNIPHIYRITKYEEPHYQHIYPVVPLPEGGHITIDCVVHDFNYEHPYSAKKDVKMELHYLNGIDNEDAEVIEIDPNNLDAMDLMDEDEDLGVIFPKFGQGFKKVTSDVKDRLNRSRFGKGIVNLANKGINVANKGIHTVAKIYPQTVLLRNGVLIGMKINMFRIAERIRWAYLSESQARSQGFDMSRWPKLKEILTKLEKIFYGAGGEPKNLKTAILTGKGNQDKAVALNGIGELGFVPEVNDNTRIIDILGADLYYAENQEVAGLNGQEGLGEGASAGLSLAAATAALGTIAALLSKIGDVRKSVESATGRPILPGRGGIIPAQTTIPKLPDAPGGGRTPIDPIKPRPHGGMLPGFPTKTTVPTTPFEDSSEGANKSTDPGASNEGNEDEPKESKGIIGWAKKNPIAATAAGVGGVGLLATGIYFGAKLLKGNKKKKSVNGINGLEGKQRQKKRTTTKRKPTGTRSNSRSKAKKVALL